MRVRLSRSLGGLAGVLLVIGIAAAIVSAQGRWPETAYLPLGDETALVATPLKQPAPTTPEAHTSTAVPRLSVGPGADYARIQEAIDAAPAGSVIQIAPGTYVEHLTIAKPLTLRGAGWEQTRITVPLESAADAEVEGADRPEPRDEHNGERSAAGQNRDWRTVKQALVLVQGATDVALSDLALIGTRSDATGKFVIARVALPLSRSKASISRCAVAGGWEGIVIGGDSSAHAAGVLVTSSVRGLRVGSDIDAGKAVVVGSEVRNCGIGIWVAKGTALVCGVRFAGLMNIGLRYTNASPVVVGNLFKGCSVAGIDTGGETGALIAQNTFLDTYGLRLSGFYEPGKRPTEVRKSDWHNGHHADQVLTSTFVSNSSGIDITDAMAGMLIEANVFSCCSTAISCNAVLARNKPEGTTESPRLKDNVFWNNDSNFVTFVPDVELGASVGRESTLPPGNRLTEPPFAAPERGDYTLHWPADEAAPAGAGNHIPLESEWPELPIEREYEAYRQGHAEQK